MMYLLFNLLFSAVFLIIYELIFRKETFFQWNRTYFLTVPIVAAILPFLKLNFLKPVIPQNFRMELPEIVIGAGAGGISESAVFLTPIVVVWIIGMLLAAVIFLFKNMKLYRLRKHSYPEKSESWNIMMLPGKSMAFTFLNRIYIGSEIEEKRRNYIIRHELVHVNQKHSYDLMYFEFLRIILWFNPFIYLFQRRISLLHEYIADDAVAKHYGKKTYYQELLSEVFQTSSVSFVNTFFNQSTIKNRITMLQKSKSISSKRAKYLLLIPVITALLFVVSCTNSEWSQEDVQKNEPFEVTEIEVPTPPLPPPLPPSPPSVPKPGGDAVSFAAIDKAPVFPGCSGNNEELKKCMSEKMMELVSENFDKSIGKKVGVEGRVRIFAQFKIDKDGKVADIRAKASHPDLEAETIRVINLVPTLTPGELEGNKVDVTYSLPIIYEVE